MSGNLFATITSRIDDPAAPFLTLPDGTSISYHDMIALSGQYANALADLGVKQGDRVAVQTQKYQECFWLYLACLRTGAIYLPLNSAYTTNEVEYFAGDAEPVLFVCDPDRKSDLAAMLSGLGIAQVETLDAKGTGSLSAKAEKMSSSFDTIELSGDELAAILYTSGTTGRSKGAMISHDNLRSNAEALVDIWRFTSSDVLLHALPIYHTHGLFVATNTVLLSGGSMLFLPKFDLDDVMTVMPRTTAMMGVPTFYIRLLTRDDFTREAADHMRIFISGSAPLSAEIHRSFTERTGKAILERYGMTETNMITSNPYDGLRKPGAVGFALPGVTVRIADPETGAVLENGEVGVIELKGPNVFKGYWRMPEKTEQEFRPDGFFITGDLGYFDDEGYVTISGRGKDLIISGGLNVYPAEVENALDEQPEISESAVIGLPHGDFGEGVTAVVVASGKGTMDEAALRSRLEDQLAKFKTPRRIIVLDALPRNTMGKIQKNVLRERFKNLYSKIG